MPHLCGKHRRPARLALAAGRLYALRMIIRKHPSGLVLLYALRGSVLPVIAPRLGLVRVISLGAIEVHHLAPVYFTAINPAPFTLLGLGLSIFLGFRNNACYARWWEGRQQWGALVAQSRALLRDIVTLLPGTAGLHHQMADHVTGFAQALRDELRDNARNGATRPSARLRQLAADLAAARADGTLSDILLTSFIARLDAMTGIQAACERLRNTPMPFAYSLMLHRTVWLFCLLVPFGIVGTLDWATPVLTMALAYAFFSLDALGEELEAPFNPSPNGLPLNALVRVIEIAAAEALGDEPPPPLAPAGFVLL